jgi:hypothetical protein
MLTSMAGATCQKSCEKLSSLIYHDSWSVVQCMTHMETCPPVTPAMLFQNAIQCHPCTALSSPCLSPYTPCSMQQKQPSWVSSFRTSIDSSLYFQLHPNSHMLAITIHPKRPNHKISSFCLPALFTISHSQPPPPSPIPPQPLPKHTKNANQTHQIHSPPNQMIPHTRTILTPSTPNQHHRMLLHIMSLSRNITRHHPPGTQPHPRCLPLCGIGFLGFCDPYFEADAFEFGG